MNIIHRKKTLFVIWMVVGVVFVILFAYSSLNLTNIDCGYSLQELRQKEKRLAEEIDRLRAEKAQWLNLQRVEWIALTQLGFQYPQPGQVSRWDGMVK